MLWKGFPCDYIGEILDAGKLFFKLANFCHAFQHGACQAVNDGTGAATAKLPVVDSEFTSCFFNFNICFVLIIHDFIQQGGFAFGEFNCLVHVTILAHARPRAS